MSYERWAVYSAKDHINLRSLIVDLILYDRIVFPVPSTQEIRVKWEERGWQPDLQKSRISKLGESICISRIWDEKMIGLHSKKLKELANNRNQVNTFISLPNNEVNVGQGFNEKGYGYELMSLNASADVLSNRDVINYNLPDGVNDFDLIAPYYSKSQLEKDIIIRDKNSIGEFGLLLESRIVVPQQLDEEKTLDEVLELIHDKEFKELRQNFYQWQKKMFKTNYSPREIINELDPGLEDLNKKIKSKFKKNILESVFTLGGVTASIAGAVFNPFALAGGAILLAKFLMVDREKVSSILDDSPFAVFYDLEKNTGIILDR